MCPEYRGVHILEASGIFPVGVAMHTCAVSATKAHSRAPLPVRWQERLTRSYVCTGARFGRKKVNFIPDSVPFFSWFLTIYRYKFLQYSSYPIWVISFLNGSRSGRYLSARSGSFLKVTGTCS